MGTYHNWRSRRLRGSPNYIYIWFTTDKEDRFAEKRIVIEFRDGELRAWIESYQDFSDGACVGPRRIRVRRPNPHSVSVLSQEGVGLEAREVWLIGIDVLKEGRKC